MWMIRYIISYKLRQENKVVLWDVLYAPNMTDRDNFSYKKLALLPDSFWNSPPFYYEMAFSLDVLCVKEHEHWYSRISLEFTMHNTRVIGLQIASKETRKRSPYCIFGVIGDVKCTRSDSKEKCTTCSVSHWKFQRKVDFLSHCLWLLKVRIFR